MRVVCFVAVMAFATGAFACDWPTRSLPENERLSDAVFVGTVIARKSTRTIELEVVEILKGSLAGRVEIPTASDCDFFLDPSIQVGEQFLVFLTRSHGGTRAGLGGGTARFVEGNADITYMRAKDRK
jgi:hypothetical protein